MNKTLLTHWLLLLTLTTTAQTYHLEQVSAIENNGRYVFLQDGYVMDNTLKNKALQTTDSYQTQQLTGQESYVWRLVKKSNTKPLYALQNCSLEDVSYLSYNESGLLLTTSSKATQWMLNFQTDGTLVILTKDQNRCLAYTSATIHQYKLYSATLDCTPYDENPGYITVLHLVSDAPADGIANVHSPSSSVQQFYDLQGRKLNSPISKGLYIVNGRIVVVRKK